MDSREIPEGQAETTQDRPAGPVPQGTRPDETPPGGGPVSPGLPPTGHPPTSSADPPAAPHPSPGPESASGEASSEPESASSEASSEPASASSEAASDGQVDTPVSQPADDKSLPASPAALKLLVKRLESERADYLQQLQRVRADFENYRKRMLRQQTEHLERAAEALVEKLLPVLDNFEAAVAHGQGFEQVQASLMALLEKEGLERIHPLEKPFDPAEADAVAHEDGDGGPVVAEVLRAGYRWKGRVVRPAMVRVRG